MTRFLTTIGTLFSGVFAATSAFAAENMPAMPERWQMHLQEPVTPVAEQLHWFHNDLLLPVITVISVFVLAIIVYIVFRYNQKANPVASKNAHNTLIEVIWTAVPVLVLVVIAIPSFKLLYFMDKTHLNDITDEVITVKVTGNQWYWSYEYPDDGISFDAIVLSKREALEREGADLSAYPADAPDEALPTSATYLFDTDTRVVLPVDTYIRFQFTSIDVLHSWAVPAFGVKLDTMPGRINESWAKITREGLYFGQCSELCGNDHAYMPIAVQVVSKDAYAAWRKQQMAGISNDTVRLASAQ